MIIHATQGQSLIDIAVQMFGDEGRVFELALLNDLSVTHQFLEPTAIMIPEEAQVRAVAVLNSYKVQVRRLGQFGRYVLVDEDGHYLEDENGNSLEASI